MDDQMTIMEVMIASFKCEREEWMKYDAYSEHMAYGNWNFLSHALVWSTCQGLNMIINGPTVVLFC